MSMHEFEDVVEHSIRLLVKHKSALEFDLRAAIRTLYEYQGQFDTGFTNLRVIDLLLEHGYTKKFPIDQHPDYASHKEYFDNLNDFEFLFLKPEDPWHAETNPEVGYSQNGFFFCDLGSDLWNRMVEIGLIQGEDAVEPGDLQLKEIVAEVVALAEADEERELIRMWYPLFIVGQDDLSEERLNELQRDPHVQAIREVTQRTGALEIEMEYGYTELPPPEAIAEIPVWAWWFELENRGADSKAGKKGGQAMN